MLDIVIENFAETFLNDAEGDIQEMNRYLAREWENVHNPGYLKEYVVGENEWEWDFRALQAGFQDLIHPYTERPSSIPLLFLRALREFDCRQEQCKHAMIFLEYSHYIVGINDFFNFHPQFYGKEVDRNAAAKLTQLKYAGQFISTYPSYLLVKDMLGISPEANSKGHQLLSNISALLGMSRGVLINWTERNFDDVTRQMYCQNSVNALCHILYFPVVLAAILSSLSDRDVDLLKKAFSYLTVFVKLRLERMAINGQLKHDICPAYLDTYRVTTFPGLYFLKNKPGSVQDIPKKGDKINFTDIHTYTMDRIQQKAFIESPDIRAEEDRAFSEFLSLMTKAGLLRETVQKIEKCFS